MLEFKDGINDDLIKLFFIDINKTSMKRLDFENFKKDLINLLDRSYQQYEAHRL